ncbi:MAG: hypothetical protein EBZ62_09465 [Sphingobacteriia bacterium]|nr:hypothetical protein [Sphingobacteriia bacterium]
MPRGKKYTAEQIIGKLREAEVELARGKNVPDVVRKLGVTEQTYYRWKREPLARLADRRQRSSPWLFYRRAARSTTV